ncbi:hypothetical protein OG21DRAFT_1490375 [Imleria badia]|nr:hypothetical protein OG21DRAFT_1490375 [Imleria badia]
MARPKSSSSGQRDRKVQPPRPRNAWIIYRSYHFSLIRQETGRMSQANVSKRISEMWRNETEEVKRHFEQEAEAEKARHQELYPDYRFCPKRKEVKQSRKKSKCHDTAPLDADADDDDDAPPAVPALPPMPYVHHFQQQTQPFFVHGYHHNMLMPQPHVIPYLPEAHYGPGGPSPPLSAAPSHQGSVSPLQPQSVASSSSTPSTQSSPTSDSPASSSSQLPANPMHLPSLPNSHQPSPHPYATQPLSTHPFQNSMPDELSLTSPRLQLRPTENTVIPATPVWNNFSSYLLSPDSQNSEEVVNLSVAVDQTQNLSEFQQGIPSSSSFDSLQALLSKTSENGVFNLSNIESSELLAHPQGDLEVALGSPPSTIDYNDDFFTGLDFVELQQQFDSLTEAGSSSAPLASTSLHEDLQSLFHIPNNPEPQAYTPAQQRRPSIFTQDIMDFLDLQAAEDSTQDTSPTASSDPIPTTISPQQVSLPSPQEAAAMPIFTQMTNTPDVASGASYVPPAGAMYSSTRRVAGSWKPPFAISPSQMDEPAQSWALQAN